MTLAILVIFTGTRSLYDKWNYDTQIRKRRKTIAAKEYFEPPNRGNLSPNWVHRNLNPRASAWTIFFPAHPGEAGEAFQVASFQRDDDILTEAETRSL